ncbi:MAG TPA: ABC transporter substrate-binding protein [Acidimicrobiales bacterium]|nr:ABC transporter substrate-binding protein [Acidimicrobiales bacterium]
MSGKRRRRLRGAENRALKGYAPLIVLVAALIAMVAVVPSQVPEGEAATGGGTATEVGEGQPASGWGTTVTACSPEGAQVPDMSYSPPCFAFTGDNGGATARGVTADTIRVAYRVTPDQNLLKTLADLGGVELDESNEELARTAEGLVEYFNQTFQFYGRRIELVRYDGRGQLLQEFLGAGQDAATNDSIRVANEIGAFADITGLSQPYADALFRNGVISVGAPYMSREWFNARRPYAWSNVPDCTAVSDVSAEYTNKRLLGRDALFAGDGLEGEPRTMAVIAPNNLEYQQCADSFEEGLAAEGNALTLRLDYTLDVATLQSQAANLLAQVKSENVTSVSCACDPIMQMYLAEEATAQGYEPEWLVAGVGFIDLDLGGQIIANRAGDQWNRAFGGSRWATAQSPQTSEAHAAYRSVRQDEPSELVDQIYAQILTVALGIQMAGPNLTPETFETGLFAFPRSSGQAGTWDFSPEHYTPVVDLREVWWSPDAVSPFNGKPGTWVDTGTRWNDGEIPSGDPEVFP